MIVWLLLLIIINTSPSGHIDKDKCAYVYDEQHEPQEIPLYGKVKVVTCGETFKVAVVPIGEDLKVKTKQFPSSCGEWQFVDIGEDFSVRFVEIGEYFTIIFVDI